MSLLDGLRQAFLSASVLYLKYGDNIDLPYRTVVRMKTRYVQYVKSSAYLKALFACMLLLLYSGVMDVYLLLSASVSHLGRETNTYGEF